jgi:GNAT superfamily N-acetyltransferase
VKAIYIPTNAIIGAAAWNAPGAPIHNFWRYSAAAFYNWHEQFNWSEADFEEMWKGVDLVAWEKKMGAGDKVREEVMGDEPHWYLAPLYTLPEFQGRGVASLLLDWAIDQADATTPYTPLYLESRPLARAVYQHKGFVPMGDYFLRRGPLSEGLVKPPSNDAEPSTKGDITVGVQQVVSVGTQS